MTLKSDFNLRIDMELKGKHQGLMAHLHYFIARIELLEEKLVLLIKILVKAGNLKSANYFKEIVG